MPRLSTSTRLRLAYAALAAVDTWLSGRPGAPDHGAHRTRLLTKPLLMPALAGSLATDPRATGSPLRTSTLLAQVGGWGGDVALLAPGTRPFLLGAGSFGVGHVAYLVGFWAHRNRSPMGEDPAVRAIAATWALSAPLVAVMAARQHRELGAPVLGYATLLAAMAASAHHLSGDLPASSRRLTSTGAALFMLSDTLLAVRKFVLTDPPPSLETAVMATYTTAQLMLSEGAARA